MRLGHELADDLKGALDPGRVDVAMGDEANGVGCGVKSPDAMRLEGVAELHGVHSGSLAVEDDDVGFYRF